MGRDLKPDPRRSLLYDDPVTRQVNYDNDKGGDEEKADDQTRSITSYLQIVESLRKTVDLFIAHLAEPG